MKVQSRLPILVIFICHIPSLWSMFESIHEALVADPNFHVTVLALPYRHSTLQAGQYEDLKVEEYLASRGVTAIRGYDPATSRWLPLESMAPDYVFLQTPYEVFPPEYSVRRLYLHAHVCYMPYGTSLFSGTVSEVAHPEAFLRRASIIFFENVYAEREFKQHFGNRSWFADKTIVVCGYPKLDFLLTARQAAGTVWRRGLDPRNKRVLWTPRWNTSERSCHFFDYRSLLSRWCGSHQAVDFVFRPHPLCFQNFLKTGELTANELAQIEQEYASSINMAIDRSADYQDTFLTSDILVSDISSMLIEYFATGKPIIYTHRVDIFNDLGHELAEGFYWARNGDELIRTLDMLVAGEDPLKNRREELRHSVLSITAEGAGTQIKTALRKHFLDQAATLLGET